jgi:hypothetical protein
MSCKQSLSKKRRRHRAVRESRGPRGIRKNTKTMASTDGQAHNPAEHWLRQAKTPVPSRISLSERQQRRHQAA